MEFDDSYFMKIALKEAEKRFELSPVKDSYDLVTLIKKRIDIDKADSN